MSRASVLLRGGHPLPRNDVRRHVVSATDWIVRGCALLAGIGALFADGKPSGTSISDAVWRIAFAVLLTYACARARRWTWFVVAGAGAALGAAGFGQLCGVFALGVAITAMFVEFRPRDLGAVVGAASSQALLRMVTDLPSRTTAVLGALAILPVLVSAYRVLERRRKRTIRRSLIWGGLGLFVLCWLLALASIDARTKVELGIARTRDAVDAARAGDSKTAASDFQLAADAFGHAHDAVGAWYLKPVEALPVIGNQAGALDVATAQGTRLAGVAATTLTSADVQRIRLVNGTVDLDALRSMQQPLADAAQAVLRAQHAVAGISRDWLVPQLADRLDDLQHQVSTAGTDAELASQSAQLLPDMLGATGPRHYLVLFTTPAESRNLGGFVGDFAEVTADGGHVQMTRSGQIAELNDYAAPDKTLSGPSAYLTTYASSRPGRYFQNVTVSPDFPEVGAATAQLYPQAPGGQPIDGVVVVDPKALAAILGITGPVTVPGLDQPLTQANAVDVLTREQYVQFGNSEPTDQQVRYDFLHEATKATFDVLTTSTTMPAPNTMVNLFGPVVSERRLLAFSLHDREQSFLTRIGMDGTFPGADGGDLLGAFESNTGPNKLDAYLHRDVDQHVVYDPSTGAVDSTVAVALSNQVPLKGLPNEVGANDDGRPFGTNETQVRLYSPLAIASATSNGAPLPIQTQVEFGMYSYTAALDVPAGQTVTIQLHLTGHIAPGPYRLVLAHQPLVNDDTIHLTVEGTGGWRPKPSPGWTVDPTSATAAMTLSEDESLSLQFGH